MRMAKILSKCTLVLHLIWLPGVTVADVYQWTDDQGQVHYSDRPVADTAREVPIKPFPSEPLTPDKDGASREERTRRMLDVYQEDREKKQQARKKESAEREKRKRNCIVAKDRYQSANRARGIYSFKKDGERQYMDEAARAKYMRKLKTNIEKWCR
jgi:hypothetical protein